MVDEARARDLDELQRLTREYASYSQSRGGLGNVLGGVVGLAIYLANGLLGPGILTAATTIGLTVVWLVGKEVIRRRLYRPLGEARETWDRGARRWHIGLVAFVALVSAGIWVSAALDGRIAASEWWPYLLIIAALPWVAWRYLRTIPEFVVGVFLLAACAVTSAGGAYELWRQPQVPLFAVALLGMGWWEHRRFGRLLARLPMRPRGGV